MSKTSSSEGTKIAQAAKELNVTSVTIRRYLAEFNIDTNTDENGVKVLPVSSMDELQLIRQLKEDGLTNPKVLEELEERRAKPAPKAKTKERPKTVSKVSPVEIEAEPEEEAAPEVLPQPARRVATRVAASKAVVAKDEEEDAEISEGEDTASADSGGAAGRSKHTLTCQTCGKVFEHMNPRLRDCLDCYRIKRKERRRGGSEKHKVVIQNPVVQQVIAKATQNQQPVLPPVRESQPQPVQQVAMVARQSTPRNYRKAIEETRGITASLKRRLERPDLPEGERRWLEQIYAYQLILHQGWRHLADYRAGTKEQARSES